MQPLRRPALLFYLGIQLYPSIDKFLFSYFPVKLSSALISFYSRFEQSFEFWVQIPISPSVMNIRFVPS